MADRVRLALDLSPLDALRKFSQQKAATLKAVRAGGKILQQAVKVRAPKRVTKGGGGLKQSIGLKAAPGKRGRSLALAVVGARKKVVKLVVPPRGKTPRKSVPAYYAHLVEKGTAPHAIQKGSRRVARRGNSATSHPIQHPGARPNPFLAPAWHAAQREAIEAMSRVLAEAVAAILAKAKK